MTEKKSTSDYNADALTALEGLDAVKKRPGMYIGSTDSKGMTHLAYEIIDNSVDEAIAGHCSKIWITLHADGAVEIADNGRGIPVDVHAKTGMSGIEVVMTKLHAGGKFGGSGYKSAGGLHGVGASVVNALSERVDVLVYREGNKYEMSFSRGASGVFDGEAPDAPFARKPGVRATGKAPKGRVGTIVKFWPDTQIFIKGSIVDTDAVRARARQTAFLVPGLEIVLRDRRETPQVEETFKFSGGVKDMVEAIATDKAICEPLHITGEGRFVETVPVLDANGHLVNQDVERTVEVNIALLWGTGYDTNIQSFVNVVSTPKGGTHVKGFERALINSLRKGYEGTRILRATEEPPTLDDATEGLTAVVSIGVPEPQYLGQTKEELGTAGVLKVVQDIVAQSLKAWLEGKKKAQARVVLEKVANAARARVASRTQREAHRRKTALEGASMPAKLVDCRAIGVERSELFLVEGDSALGSARAARNSEYQALLPLRGKILNVQRASLADMLKNSECAAIIQVLGAGSGRSFDLQQMRYGRLMLMSDADVDGSHIRCLLVTLIHKYMRPIIEEGRLYATMPPLHKVEVMGRGGETIYTYTQAEMEATVARLEGAGKKAKQPIQRYKGLGEMNADALWETTMNPATRTVRRITLEDAEAAEKSLELLMGNAVEPRRDWLIANADQVDREAIDA